MAWDSTAAKRCNLIDMKSIHVVTADRHMIISTGNNGTYATHVGITT